MWGDRTPRTGYGSTNEGRPLLKVGYRSTGAERRETFAVIRGQLIQGCRAHARMHLGFGARRWETRRRHFPTRASPERQVRRQSGEHLMYPMRTTGSCLTNNRTARGDGTGGLRCVADGSNDDVTSIVRLHRPGCPLGHLIGDTNVRLRPVERWAWTSFTIGRSWLACSSDPHRSMPARTPMATLQIDLYLPELTPAQSLSGWRREF